MCSAEDHVDGEGDGVIYPNPPGPGARDERDPMQDRLTTNKEYREQVEPSRTERHHGVGRRC